MTLPDGKVHEDTLFRYEALQEWNTARPEERSTKSDCGRQRMYDSFKEKLNHSEEYLLM